MNGTPSILAVLIVDDNAEWSRQVRLRIERSLPESSRVVRWEATLSGARRALKDFHADATILDLCLPDSPDPYLTMPAIRELFPPVFVMSDFLADSNPLQDQLTMDCMKAGAFTVYAKDETSVAHVVREIVFTHVRNTVQTDHVK